MIKIRCLVENAARRASALWGEHGMAFHIQTPDGAILFDTGQSGEVLLHNARELGIDLAQIDALAISHAHYDHTGGLMRVLEHTRPMIPLYASPDLFRARYSVHDGALTSIGVPFTREKLAPKVEFRLNAEPVEILPGVWTTGEIPDRSDFEGRSATHQIRDGDGWQPDPYRDDFSLVIQAAEGLVVLFGCGHAGLLNILKHVKRTFRREIITVVGGMHLISATEDDLRRAIVTLKTNFGTPDVYPCHCTGETAYVALARAFSDKTHPCPAGTLLTYET
ncbi:MAG: MBL fold metallo-hydrolase [Anaerolineae bacterium]|nr:MBL fold metallo-hydrolase [Anaerolineae bacterium]